MARTPNAGEEARRMAAAAGGNDIPPAPPRASLDSGGDGEGPALVSMAQAFSGLPMESLIGGPLSAAAEANMQMGLAQVNFMMSTCFYQPEPPDGPFEPRLIKVRLERPVIRENEPLTPIEPAIVTIEMPLLALLPLNNLGVTNVDVSFTMNVSSSFSNERSTTLDNKVHAEASYETAINYFFAKTTIKGSASVDTQLQQSTKAQYQKQNNATYTVNVNASQLPLPPGVTTIIQAFTNNMAPIVLPAAE